MLPVIHPRSPGSSNGESKPVLRRCLLRLSGAWTMCYGGAHIILYTCTYATYCCASTFCDTINKTTATTAQFLQAAAITVYSYYYNCMKTESTATDVAFRVSSY